MVRLRFTLAEAEEEATRLATEYVTRQPNTENARLHHVSPVKSAPKSAASKHPVVWCVSFVFHPPDVIIDGGELMLDVNVETKEVRPWP